MELNTSRFLLTVLVDGAPITSAATAADPEWVARAYLDRLHEGIWDEIPLLGKQYTWSEKAWVQRKLMQSMPLRGGPDIASPDTIDGAYAGLGHVVETPPRQRHPPSL